MTPEEAYALKPGDLIQGYFSVEPGGPGEESDDPTLDEDIGEFVRLTDPTPYQAIEVVLRSSARRGQLGYASIGDSSERLSLLEAIAWEAHLG